MEEHRRRAALHSLQMSKSSLVTPNGVSMPQNYSSLETGVPELKPLSSGLKVGP